MLRTGGGVATRLGGWFTRVSALPSKVAANYCSVGAWGPVATLKVRLGGSLIEPSSRGEGGFRA